MKKSIISSHNLDLENLNAKDLRKILFQCSLKDLPKVIERIKSRIPEIVTNGKILVRILNCLNWSDSDFDKQSIATVFNALNHANKFPQLVNSTSVLSAILPSLSCGQINALFRAIHTSIPSLIDSYQAFENVCSTNSLNTTQSQFLLLNADPKKLFSIAEECGLLFKRLDTENQGIILTAFKDIIFPLYRRHDPAVLLHSLKALAPKFRLTFFNALKDSYASFLYLKPKSKVNKTLIEELKWMHDNAMSLELKSGYSPSELSLHHLYYLLEQNIDSKDKLIHAIKDRLPNLICSFEDFKILIKLLKNDSLNKTVINILKPKIKTFISEIEDRDSFYQLIKMLPNIEIQKEFILINKENILNRFNLLGPKYCWHLINNKINKLIYETLSNELTRSPQSSTSMLTHFLASIKDQLPRIITNTSDQKTILKSNPAKALLPSPQHVNPMNNVKESSRKQ